MADRDPPPVLGPALSAGGATFTLRAPRAEALRLCLFDAHDRQTAVQAFRPLGQDLFTVFVPGLAQGARYGIRAEGPWAPERGDRFDPAKLLVDPWATRLDRPFAYCPDLAHHGVDTAALVPKAVLEAPLPDIAPAAPRFGKGGLVYEVPVRAFTMLHPAVPKPVRGTLAALAHPEIVAHLKSLHVGAVQLMPIAAWIDERHLPPLGLSNAWGYNPVTFMALDPRLAPGGMADLRQVVSVLGEAGIDVFLDVVFNHTGESDEQGPTLSLRGLGNATFYRHERDDPGRLVNDTGCGNTLACERPEVLELVLGAMRHFVLKAGVAGFRFDLATVLGRTEHGFAPDAPFFERIAKDPILSDRIMIAEPWDIGPGGYRLGQFPDTWLEWNDRARDDIRAFWRGDAAAAGPLATRLAGSSDLFAPEAGRQTRSVNFIAAHDGFTLADLVSYAHKHNEANGEDNRDGHAHNLSWNNGVEGPTRDPAILEARRRDRQALLATLFASRGTLMLTAGDEFGHSQAGNNNAYAQDNAVTWRDWSRIDGQLLDFVRRWAELRSQTPLLRRLEFLRPQDGSGDPDQAGWYGETGAPLTAADWERDDLDVLVMVLGAPGARLALGFNRGEARPVRLPPASTRWIGIEPAGLREDGMAARSVRLWREGAPSD